MALCRVPGSEGTALLEKWQQREQQPLSCKDALQHRGRRSLSGLPKETAGAILGRALKTASEEKKGVTQPRADAVFCGSGRQERHRDAHGCKTHLVFPKN
jgi:hypothetical protein